MRVKSVAFEEKMWDPLLGEHLIRKLEVRTREDIDPVIISYPAPALKQYADEDLLIQIGAVIFPGSLKRWTGENGFRIWVEGTTPNDGPSRAGAAAIFMTVLGELRAWRSAAGELREEGLSGLGEGTARDEGGNRWLPLGTAMEYTIPSGEVDDFAEKARVELIKVSI